MWTSYSRGILLLAILAIFTIAALGPARAQYAWIALLTPSSDPDYTLEQTLLAGAEFATLNAPNVSVQAIEVDYSDHGAVIAVFDELERERPAAVIGGLTSATATQVFMAAKDHAIPTILLASPDRWLNLDVWPNIIQIGIPDPAIYRIGLEHWITLANVDYAQVIYRGDNEPSFSLGAKISPYLLKGLSSGAWIPYGLTDISPYSSDSAAYTYDFEGRGDHPGIVLAGLYDQSESVLDSLNRALPSVPYSDASILIANPQSEAKDVADVANRSSLVSYGVSQFLFDPANEPTHRHFIDNLEDQTSAWYGEQPWLDRNFALSTAAKAHDAVKLVITAVNAWGPNWDPRTTGWLGAHSPGVQGITGDLTFLTPYLVAGPIYFVSAEPHRPPTKAILPVN